MKYLVIAVIVAVAAVAFVEISAMAVEPQVGHFGGGGGGNLSDKANCDQGMNNTSGVVRFENATCNLGCIVRYLFKGMQAKGCLVNNTCACYKANGGGGGGGSSTTTALPIN